MHKSIVAVAIATTLALSGCSNTHSDSAEQGAQVQLQNPLLQASSLQYQAPDFSQLKDEHYQPALELGMAQHHQQILDIANNPAAPTFENTIVAMEKSGTLLTRTSSIFYNLTGSNSNPELRKVQGIMAPKMAAHSDNINLNPELFSRIQAIYDSRTTSSLTAEEVRLVEVYHQRFVLAGAKLTEAEKQKIRDLNEEQSTLTNEFAQRLLRLSKEIAVKVDDESKLAGLSQSAIAAAKADAEAAGLEGQYLLNITNTTRQPVLAQLDNRELRQQVWEASANRGLTGDNETASLVARLAQLRAKKANLLGFDTWSDYRLAPQMAKTPEAVYDMFGSMVPAVVENTQKEAA